ncbi:ankyrin repeat domain-containing protein [Candidatus Babela massiliensis]|uniref:Ankyrin repeats containing protein n=1 Tax=Candidatus Babela massiliensis TaxID=673862 RepID=V6DHQ8_9BACT|nr:ankyrin repeat domain-containing protein [Candidatus Babela massiliensis]CDK31079.1 Ankyrin repeats containing protein [Candidatus Babela massiliensis]
MKKLIIIISISILSILNSNFSYSMQKELKEFELPDEILLKIVTDTLEDIISKNKHNIFLTFCKISKFVNNIHIVNKQYNRISQDIKKLAEKYKSPDHLKKHFAFEESQLSKEELNKKLEKHLELGKDHNLYQNQAIRYVIAGANPNLEIESFGQVKSALTLSAEYGYLNLVKVLLKYNANVSYPNEWHLETALIIAVKNKNLRLIKILLPYNISLKSTEEINTALKEALEDNSTEIVKLLLKDIDNLDSIRYYFNNFTPLMYAIDKNNIEITKIILEKYPNVELQDIDGNTALILAVKNDNLEIIKLILKHYPNINTQNKFGYTALMYAIENNNEEVIKYLMERNPDLTLINQNQNNITHIAYRYKNQNIIDIINKKTEQDNLEIESLDIV